MTALASQQVIDAVAARLVAAGTDSGSRVHTSRFHPVAEFPSTKVLHVDESLRDIDEDVTWPRNRLHTLQIDVQVLVHATDALDAAMSTAALQVLQALEGVQAPLAPLPVLLQSTGIRYQAAAEGQAAHGVATVRFEAQFHTNANAPETLI